MSEKNVDAPSFEFDHSNMFEPILRADPSFLEKWEEFRAEFQSDNELPLYGALSELARHLIESLEAGNTSRFGAIFDVVERWHIRGDAYVRQAATVGLLEDLQNESLYREARSDDFLPWLEPETLQWWTKVHQFWTTGKPIV